MTTTPARHPHRAIDADADHPKNDFPPIEPARTRTGHHPAYPHPWRAA